MLGSAYLKEKDALAGVLAAWNQFADISIEAAKVQYITFCRNLSTYGILFPRKSLSIYFSFLFILGVKYFDAMWRGKAKTKLVPVRLGILPSKIHLLDPATKKILEDYPLTHLQKWMGGPNSFTLGTTLYPLCINRSCNNCFSWISRFWLL